MKITKAQLQEIIKEELGNLSEAPTPASDIGGAAGAISYLATESLIPMIRRGDSPDAIIKQLYRIVGWAEEITEKARDL